MALSLCWSSRTSESTTRASSMAVVRRGGALARSSSSFWSIAEPACSTTMGTSLRPAAIQWARRLKPSRTSKQPSGCAATRSGISARTGAPCGGGVALERSGARLVRSLSTSQQRSSGTPPDSASSGLTAGGARARAGACAARSSRDPGAARAGTRRAGPDRPRLPRQGRGGRPGTKRASAAG